ncbi:MAG: ATP-binding protein [Dethiobacteria bacterium]
MNLLNNAVKFTEQGQITLNILLEKNEADRVVVRFEVEDTGIGIPIEKQGNVFEPFYQLDEELSSFNGSGLGLAICKRLVELMQGQIGVKSIPGKGSTFWFTVPLQRPDSTVEPAEEKNRLSSTALQLQEKDKSKTVLVVEDNIISQKLICYQLEKIGLKVECVKNGKQAVSACAQNSYTLIFMDCQLPEMDGYEAAKKIRSQEAAGKRRTPIIATTAGIMPEEREKCLNAGMDDILIKPISINDLKRILARWLPDSNAASSGGEEGLSDQKDSLVNSFAADFVPRSKRNEFSYVVVSSHS